MKTSPVQIKVSKYKGGPYWAVWINEELLAVVVYKKGALAIREMIRNLSAS